DNRLRRGHRYMAAIRLHTVAIGFVDELSVAKHDHRVRRRSIQKLLEVEGRPVWQPECESLDRLCGLSKTCGSLPRSRNPRRRDLGRKVMKGKMVLWRLPPISTTGCIVSASIAIILRDDGVFIL